MKRHPFEPIIKMSKSAFTIAENRKIGIFRTQSIPQPKNSKLLNSQILGSGNMTVELSGLK